MDKQYVWYLSYGSNLSRERFMTYIEGGTPKGSTKRERGCRDKTPPIKDEFLKVPFPLYFSHHSKRWNGGPAFISTQKSVLEKTYARMYLITKEQFEDIVAQENSLYETNIEVNEIKKRGFCNLYNTLYGTIVYIGNKDGFDIFSFTTKEKLEDVIFTKPSIPYLSMILSGLLSNPTLTKEMAIEYLHNARRVSDFYSLEELKKKL